MRVCMHSGWLGPSAQKDMSRTYARARAHAQVHAPIHAHAHGLAVRRKDMSRTHSCARAHAQVHAHIHAHAKNTNAHVGVHADANGLITVRWKDLSRT